MPVASYMSRALYHPEHGYFATGPRSGRHGHFVTSPELDPSFGELWAAGFEQVWSAAGRPASFEVTEVGPGEGGFAAAVLETVAGPFAAALSYRLVERMPLLRARQEERLAPFLGSGRRARPKVSWSPSLPEAPPAAAGCVFANEVLDNLPVHVVERRAGRLMEVCVAAPEGVLVEALLEPSSPELARWLSRCGMDLPEGHRCEVGLAAESFVRRAAGLLGRGAVILIDYGAEAAELAARPAGTLVCYSEAGADDAYLERPGEKDITAHVNWGAVHGAGERAGLETAGPRAQKDVLVALGARHSLDLLRAEREAASSAGDGAAVVRAVSRAQALNALMDQGGLGSLGVLTGATGGLRPPGFPFAQHP